MRATFPALLDNLELIFRVIFRVEYLSWSFSLCSILQLPVNSSDLGLNIFFQNPIVTHL